jgi:hypothetical protein
MTAARQVARHRNRAETLDLATDVLVIGSVPPAAWAAVGAAAANARVNSTGGQARRSWTRRIGSIRRVDSAGLDRARHRGF